MKSLVLTITVLLGLLLVPAIEMKRKRCHKRPALVECPEPLPMTCAHWNITVTTGERYAGNTGQLNCSTGYSLIGNNSITCLASGIWSPIIALCVQNYNGRIDVRSFRGTTYIYVNNGQSYEQAKETCTSMCGTLWEVNNQEEKQFVTSAINQVGMRHPWIGLESKNGTDYVWQSGNTTVSNAYEDWDNGYPIRHAVGSCVFLSPYNDNKWVDAVKFQCAWERQFICESSFSLQLNLDWWSIILNAPHLRANYRV
ncbi:Hypothetical predicted protein [Mytilus galloprovincialis]|uniref:C-type lectin domain-containing protein n=1 Tax=Mytilus galloprovincialis TaxID=29158 RepID=A0A8B6HQ86_MYTGA|nr:Hypothetical predicted protein [Mytilus galloprovincialis]